MGRKTSVWTFQPINKLNLKRENLDMAKNLKGETESLLTAESNNAIRINYV